MRTTTFGMMIAAVLASGMIFFSCGGKEESVPGGSAYAPGPASTPSGNPQQDYTLPYLNDEKINNFIASLKEELNPFEMMFKAGGKTQGLADLKDRLDEYNAFAQKYGFKDYADYMTVWGRITVGELLIWSESMSEGTAEMYKNTIKSAEEALKNPDLDAEMKKIYEDQIVSSKKGLEDMKNEKKDDSSLNAADLELVKKYKAQIDQETAKFKQKPN